MPPQIPVLNSQQVSLSPLPAPRAPVDLGPTGMQYLAQGINDLTEVMGKMQQASDAAEAGRLARETSADLQATVKELEQKLADPAEFETQATESIQRIRETRLGSASNPNVRRMVEANIGDDFRLRQADILTSKYGKMRSKAQGDWVAMKVESLQQYAAAENDVEERVRIQAALGNTLKMLGDANLVNAEEKQKELAGLQQAIAEIDIRRDFKSNPIETLEKLDKGTYSKNILPDRLNQIRTSLAESYRVAQAEIRRQTAEQQDKNFADAMIKARQPGGLTQADVDALSAMGPDGTRKIDAQQAVHLINQIKATGGSGGVLYSDPAVLSDLQFRLHRGVVSATEIRNNQLAGKLTIGDANELYNGLEARHRRDRTEAREARADAKLNDIANDPNYKRAENYIKAALPNADRLDLEHSFRMMVGEAVVEFDRAARAKDENGKPKYGAKDLQSIAESIVDGTLQKMDLTGNSARARLKPGIKTIEDIGNAVREQRLTPMEAREQARLLLQLGGPTATAPVSPLTQPAGRNDSAKDRARAQGAQ